MRREDGFTLIEMLVALAVFAIAALALMRLDLFAVRQAGVLADARLAGLVARNEAALATTDPSITVGDSQRSVTNGGRGFLVARRVTPTDDRRLVRIDIGVQALEGTARSAATLVKRVQ